ncbi:ATP-grasp domain-containing protein [Pseudohoeflea suaedae]|uniref:ATP-grasp domain-containing protein n=1 Tax=Pseudohoeflea suaedae TaxID=877384 RepID=A0A4R5PMT6_9HYPH|nr:ATP-grasp domain-containing protein [Pseudohoeflea suaedae]TDH38330.1 ATP-grasp domain-containing protein [Pseudohoeflea suaedae]
MTHAHTRKATILLLAAGEPLVKAIESLKRGGFRVIAMDRNEDAPGHAIADGSIFGSIEDADAVTEAARGCGADLVMAATEAGVLAAATASQQLGLPGIGVEVALNCLDKGRMRQAWKQAGLCQPDFRLADTEDGLRRAVHDIGLPAVIKPRRSWASKGVSVVTRHDQLDEAIDGALRHSGSHGCIVERFIDGPLLTCDGFVNDGHVTFSMIGDVEFQDHDRYRVNMSLNYPANYPAAVIAEARALVAGAIEAVGHRQGAFHCECIVSDDGVHLVEIGARPGGGHLFAHAIEQASGLDAPVVLARLLLRWDVDPAPRKSGGACYRFLAAPAGRFIAADGLEAARNHPGVATIGLTIRPGDTGGAVSHDNARHGWAVTGGADRQEALERARAALAAIRLEME